MVIMFGVNHLIIKLGLDWAIDTKVKSRISGAMSDFAITAAIASLPVEAVMEYAVPILVMCAIGFVLTYIFVFKLGTSSTKATMPLSVPSLPGVLPPAL